MYLDYAENQARRHKPNVHGRLGKEIGCFSGIQRI